MKVLGSLGARLISALSRINSGNEWSPILVRKSHLNQINIWWLVCLVLPFFIQGCVIPRSVIEHDGLDTTVIDSKTKQPLSDAFVFSHGAYLGKSGLDGRVTIPPARKIEFVPLLGEAKVMLAFFICKEGYESKRLITGFGWNADFRDSTFYKEVIELSPSQQAVAKLKCDAN